VTIILDSRFQCKNCRWVELAPTRKGMMQNLKCGLPEGFMMDAQVPHEDWGCTDFELDEPTR